MSENITKIKVDDDVRCISLDTEVIDTTTFGRDSSGKLGVKLGSSMRTDNTGIGVKIHPDTYNYLQPEPSGLSLKLDTMADDMAIRMADLMMGTLGLTIDAYNNLSIGTAPLKLGTGLVGSDNGHALCLSIGSGLKFDPYENKIRLKIDEGQQLLMLMPDGTQTFNLDRLYGLLEARYNLTKK